MVQNTLGRFERIELHFYEMLGLKQFRRAILLFEKIRRRKDGSLNVNYHLSGTSASALTSFSGYLLYNTTFHIASLLLVLVYFAVTGCLQLNHLWLDMIMYADAVFNLYCIMLQRYVYLRIQSQASRAAALRERRIQAASGRISPLLEGKGEAELLEEYDLIQRLLHSMETGADCVLDADCADALERLAIAAERAGTANPPRASASIHDASLSQILSNTAGRTRLTGRVPQRVSRLQKLLRRPAARNVLFGYCMITESAKCEEAFCRLFPRRSRDQMEFTTAALLAAYQQKGLAKR
ncbi:MAG: hypothetical protein ACI4XW_05415 [Candidatus Spyradocola sp.]